MSLMSLVLGYRGTAVIGAAVRLGLPEALAGGGLTVEEAARRTGTAPDGLLRLLRALDALGVVRRDGDRYVTTGEGEALRSGPLRRIALVASELSAPAATELAGALRDGEVPFERRFGTGFYDHLEADPELAAVYGEAIGAPRLLAAVAAGRDFSGRHVVDLGGGLGDQLALILDRAGTAVGTLVELPGTAEAAARRMARFGSRIQCVAGDLRVSVPPGGDVYLLVRVLANWDDATALAVLKNCAAAMSPGAVLLVVEMPAETADPFGELELFLHFGGRLRTRGEWRSLLRAAGLKITRASSPGGGWAVLEAARA